MGYSIYHLSDFPFFCGLDSSAWMRAIDYLTFLFQPPSFPITPSIALSSSGYNQDNNWLLLAKMSRSAGHYQTAAGALLRGCHNDNSKAGIEQAKLKFAQGQVR